MKELWFHVAIKGPFGIGYNFGITISGLAEMLTVFGSGAFKKRFVTLNLVEPSPLARF